VFPKKQRIIKYEHITNWPVEDWCQQFTITKSYASAYAEMVHANSLQEQSKKNVGVWNNLLIRLHSKHLACWIWVTLPLCLAKDCNVQKDHIV
jgi:hypothetical protein